jgi:predicted nuclease of predicted toxin-antitoxin system
MLSLLLDENMSPEIVRQIREKRSDIAVASIHHWHEGKYKAQRDEEILIAAAQEGLTLVTYDQKTILPVLVQWGQIGTDHTGIVFIDDRSIASNNFGALVRTLILLWDSSFNADWTNRIEFLRPKP